MTSKQDKAISILMNSDGKTPTSKAMIQAGYAPSVANRPEVLTKSKAYQELIVPKLKARNVTIDKYIDNIALAMNANHKVEVEGDYIDTGEANIALRLQGNKQAEKLLKIDSLLGIQKSDDNPLTKEELELLASESDTIELTKLVFSKLS